jgi:hypothetical protein
MKVTEWRRPFVLRLQRARVLCPANPFRLNVRRLSSSVECLVTGRAKAEMSFTMGTLLLQPLGISLQALANSEWRANDIQQARRVRIMVSGWDIDIGISYWTTRINKTFCIIPHRKCGLFALLDRYMKPSTRLWERYARRTSLSQHIRFLLLTWAYVLYSEWCFKNISL